jgi:hypothetical protein
MRDNMRNQAYGVSLFQPRRHRWLLNTAVLSTQGGPGLLKDKFEAQPPRFCLEGAAPEDEFGQAS